MYIGSVLGRFFRVQSDSRASAGELGLFRGAFCLALLGCCLTGGSACKSSEGPTTEESNLGSSLGELQAETEVSALGRAVVLSVDPVPPTMESLFDPRHNPYLHNPISWQYLVVQSQGESVVFDARLAMTSTWRHEPLADVGVLMNLVVEVQGSGPVGTALGYELEQEYQSRTALLTPSGLFMSNPNPGFGSNEEALDALLGGVPTWPLPEASGCSHRVADFELPFGALRGLWTDCPDLDSDYGRARVSTVWVERVGFVYREIRPFGEDAGPVYRDYLLSGDLVELAARASDEVLIRLLP